MAEHKKKIVHNFISLSLVQGVSILFPLITFPYLLRVLGVESFGIFTLVQTFVMYFDLFISFGFGLTATKYITRSIYDIEKTQEVISAVYFIKLILFAITILVFLGFCIFVPYLRQNFLLVLISFMYLMGNLLFPDWYFQGIQKMRNIAVVAFVSKLVSLLLIIILVRKSNDIVYAMLSVSAGNFISGLLGFVILYRSISLKIKIPGKEFLVSLFKEAAYVFSSIILAPLYSSVNLFVLQAFTNPLMVGYYAIAEKIFSAVGMLTSIANRTFYPHLTQLYSTSIPAYKNNIQRIVLLFMGAFIFLAVMQFSTAELVVKLVSGKKNIADISYAVDILRIMSIGLLFSPYVSFFFQLLIIQGQKKESVRNIIIVILLNLVCGSIFTYFYSGKGMAINLCTTVLIIGLLNYISFNKKLKSLSINEHAAD